MELCFAMNGLYFCFMLDGCLYFSISALIAVGALVLFWNPVSTETSSCQALDKINTVYK